MLKGPSAERLSREQVAVIYRSPLLDLIFRAAEVHRQFHDPEKIQCSTLLNIKTGACPEDCAYCSQSARYDTGLENEPLMDVEAVAQAALKARLGGADRFCMGAAWRGVQEGEDFEQVLEMVRRVKELGLETCATLGLLNASQAERLKEAGLDYYNHNLDTSPEHYKKIITTRRYEDRLETLEAVRQSGMKVCCGGILGLGESEDDRITLLYELSSLSEAPESVPINALVPIEGTPLESAEKVPWDQILRSVASARILMPRSMVRLSAGRRSLSEEAQTLCFLAGANSIFLGDRLLTTANRTEDEDTTLFAKLGLTPLDADADKVYQV